jgi:hypothetical protein
MNNVVVIKKSGVDLESVVNQKIDYKINKIRNELVSSNELQEKLTNKIVERKIVSEYELKYNVSKIKLEYELEEFIKVQFSEKTKVLYKFQIGKFIEYCKNNKIETLKITPKEVDGYMNFLNSMYSPRTVRNSIMCVNSFFKFMIYRYPDCFKLNSFRDRKLPKISDTRRKDFCTIQDVKELKNEFKRIGRNDIICIIDLVCKYGFRVGIFSKMKIDREGNWISESKGRDYKGKFLKSECKKIRENNVLKLSTSTVINIIRKYTQKLFDKGLVTCPFSVHDLRRLYIRINLNECKNGTEILNFSRKIHKNLNTTIGYL